jgi:hypothetical protein
VSPIDNLAYAVGNASRADVVGGPDPSVQPSANWVLIPDPNGGGGVSQLTAGTNVTLTPPTGLGNVTVSATAGAGGVSQIVAGTNVTVSPLSGLGTVTVNSAASPVLSVVAGTNITSVVNAAGNWTVNAPNPPAVPVQSVVAGTNITSVVDVAGNWTVNAPAPPVTRIVAGTNVTISPLSGLGDVTIDATGGGGGAPFVDMLQRYVAPNGNDITGDGSQQNPFLTIGRAIVARTFLPTTTEVSIILSSGTYNETVTITRNTYIVGVQTGESRQPVNVTGNITMNDTNGSMGISGLEVVGNVSTIGTGASYTIFGCNISGGAAIAVTATAGTVFITECRISVSGNTSVIQSQSTLTIRDCVVSTSGTGSCVFLSATTNLRQSNFISSSASTANLAIIRIGNSSTNTVEIGNCRIEYTSTVVDVGGNKCCIQFAGAGASTASIYSNLLLCEGAITGSPQIQCIQDTGAGAVVLSYGQLIAGATAHHIAGTVTKTQYTTVP